MSHRSPVLGRTGITRATTARGTTSRGSMSAHAVIRATDTSASATSAGALPSANPHTTIHRMPATVGMRSEVSMRTELMTVGRATRGGRGAGESSHSDEHRRPGLPVLLTIDEAADLLRTTRRAIYAMVERRQLPGVIRIRRRVLLRADDLLHWLDQKRAPSPKE